MIRRPPPRVAATVVAVALSLSLALPAGAADDRTPKPPDPASPYVGVLYPQLPNATRPWENDPAGNRKLLSRAYEAGMRWTYIWVAWSDIETQRGVYDEAKLAKLDAYLALAREEGIHVVVQLMIGHWGYPQYFALPYRRNSVKTPGLLAPGPSPDVAPLPVDATLPVDWVQLLVRRYRPGGDLARTRGWSDRYGVTAWEIENEPDNGFTWWGTWIDVPKDYAEYLSVIGPAIKAADPDALVKAPALSHQEGGPLKGTAWLSEVLSPGDGSSEWASDTYRRSGGGPGAGCHVDAFSFHRNNPTLHDKQAAARADAVRALAAGFESAPVCPTSPTAQYHYSEGSALQYTGDPLEFSWAQTQLMTTLLGVGVDKMTFSPAAEINKDPWSAQPVFKAMRALSSHLPRADEVVAADGSIDPARVTAYVRTDPVTGLRTWVVWAHTLPPGAETGESFEVEVPVRTGSALVIDRDWSQREVVGPVMVTLTPADPSPTVMVVETGELPPNERPRNTRNGRTGAGPR